MIEILYIVFWVLGLIFLYPWPSAPPWSAHAYYLLMLALAGIAIFGLGVSVHRVM